jgi:hypothetical protein
VYHWSVKALKQCSAIRRPAMMKPIGFKKALKEHDELTVETECGGRDNGHKVDPDPYHRDVGRL